MPGGGAVVANAWLDRMLAFWSPAWTLGGCLVAAAVALVVRHRLARSTGLSPGQAAVYVLAIGVALAVTLSPRSAHDTYYIFSPMVRRCDVALGAPDVVAALTTAEWSFNLALFVPVGWVCGWASGPRASWRLIGGAALAPALIEAVQYLATDLHRTCQGLDLATNWLGLIAGCAAAVAWRRLASRPDLPGTTPSGHDPSRSPTAAADRRGLSSDPGAPSVRSTTPRACDGPIRTDLH